MQIAILAMMTKAQDQKAKRNRICAHEVIFKKKWDPSGLTYLFPIRQKQPEFNLSFRFTLSSQSIMSTHQSALSILSKAQGGSKEMILPLLRQE